MSRWGLVSLVLAVGVSSAAVAQPVKTIARTTDPTVSDLSVKGDPDRRVCKAVVATGSRLNKAKVCKTAKEWQEERAEDRKQLERLQRERSSPTMG